MGVPVRHLGVTGGEVYFVKYKDKSRVSGEFLKIVSEEGQLGTCVVLGQGHEKFILQKGHCFCFIFPLLNVELISNKNTSSSYTVFCTFDIFFMSKAFG